MRAYSAVVLAALLLAPSVSFPRDEDAVPDPCPVFNCQPLSTTHPYINAHEVYLRYFAGSSSIDYLAGGPDDPAHDDYLLTVHKRRSFLQNQGSAHQHVPYLCVDAVAGKFGSQPRHYRGWVNAQCVCNCENSPNCTDVEDDGATVPMSRTST